MNRRFFLIIAALFIVGCKPRGPATTHTASTKFPTVAERADFLHQYVSFRRTYETLDFEIKFQNNGGGLLPAPSDWDVRIVATVPEAELEAWVPPGVSAAPVHDTDWLKSIPTILDLTGVNEWYSVGGRVIGLDRSKRIVVYRLLAL